MYVDYETFLKYTLYAPEEMPIETYEKLAPMSDSIIDNWTLERVGKAVKNEEELPGIVISLYCSIVEQLPALIENGRLSKGGLVSSFSNGIDSYTFEVNESMSSELYRTLSWKLELLPVEWISACVAFDGGNKYAS